MKKLVSITLIIVLTAALTGCGDGAKNISNKQYKEIMSQMGIAGMESAVDGVTLSEAFKIKTKFNEETHDGEDDIFAAQCGEKDVHYYAAYALETDEDAAAEKRDAYIEVLTEAGYEHISTYDIFGDFYSNGSYGVMVKEVIGTDSMGFIFPSTKARKIIAFCRLYNSYLIYRNTMTK